MNDKPPALTLRNLTGAFIVLLFGLGISFLAFLCELIISLPNLHNRLLKKVQSDSVNFDKNTQVKPSVNAVENIHENALKRTAKVIQNEPKIYIEDEFVN